MQNITPAAKDLNKLYSLFFIANSKRRIYESPKQFSSLSKTKTV